MLHFLKMGFPTEWDPSSCMLATMWFLVPKLVQRGRYNTILSTKDRKEQRITSLNGSTKKLHSAHRSLFQATIQILLKSNSFL